MATSRARFLWNAYTDLRDRNDRPLALEELQRLLSHSGISSDTFVVTYGYGAPLGFWMLEAHGHANARMLMGSRAEWPQRDPEWSTDVPESPDGEHPLLTEQPHLLAPRDAVEAAIDDPSAILVDVRAESEYGGERFWPQAPLRTLAVPVASPIPSTSRSTRCGQQTGRKPHAPPARG
jgi:3-mercaptopyruvate sulfurtransferase SseA